MTTGFAELLDEPAGRDVGEDRDERQEEEGERETAPPTHATKTARPRRGSRRVIARRA